MAKTESKSRSRSATSSAAKARKPDKPHTWLTDEMAATLVAEAEITPAASMPHVLERYGVSGRTFERWKTRVARDPALAAIVTRKRAELAEVWDEGSKRAARMLLMAIEHHAELALAMKAFDPDAMHKCSGSLKVVNEAMALRTMVPNERPVRGTRKDPPPGAPPGVGGEPRTGDRPPAPDRPVH